MSAAATLSSLAPSTAAPSSVPNALATDVRSLQEAAVRATVDDMMKDEKVQSGLAGLLSRFAWSSKPRSPAASHQSSKVTVAASPAQASNAEDRLNQLWRAQPTKTGPSTRSRGVKSGLPSTWKVTNSINIKPHWDDYETEAEAAARPKAPLSYGTYNSLEDFASAQDTEDLVNVYNARHCRTVCNTLGKDARAAKREGRPKLDVLNYTDKWGNPVSFDYSKDDRRRLVGSTCLIDRGRDQGNEMGEILSHYPTIDFVITSALPRTEESASHYLQANKQDWTGGEKSGVFTRPDGSTVPYVSTAYMNETKSKDLSHEMSNVARLITEATKAGKKNILVSGHGNWQAACSKMWEAAGATKLDKFHDNGEHRIHTLKRSDILAGASELDNYTGFWGSITPSFESSGSTMSSDTASLATASSVGPIAASARG